MIESELTILTVVLIFIAGFVVGRWYANKIKIDKELADPTVHVLERRIYWLANIEIAYNKIKQIFDDNPDKFECLCLEYQYECYNPNRFYCRYRSIGNKYVIKIHLTAIDEPYFVIEENKQ